MNSRGPAAVGVRQRMERAFRSERLSVRRARQALCGAILAIAMSVTSMVGVATAAHLFKQPDCAYPLPLDPGAYLHLPCPASPTVPSVPSPPPIPQLPASCRAEANFDVKVCVRDLKAAVPGAPTLPLPAACVSNSGFDPLSCLTGVTPPLPNPPPPRAPPALPPIPGLPTAPSVTVPAECNGGSAYECARALVLQITGSDCIISDLSGNCFEQTEDPGCPTDTVGPTLYWLGPSFESLTARNAPVVTCSTESRTNPALSGNHTVAITYGSCTITSDSGLCPAPLEVQTTLKAESHWSRYTVDGEPYPAQFITVANPHVNTSERSASFDGGTRIEMYLSDVTIAVTGDDAGQVARAANAVQPVPATAECVLNANLISVCGQPAAVPSAR